MPFPSAARPAARPARRPDQPAVRSSRRASSGIFSGLRQRLTPARSRRRSDAPALAAGVSAQNLHKQFRQWGKVLGSGAGGTVHLVKRKDHRIFAIKQFRPLRNGESERDYLKKITAEFCVGVTLRHPNIIHTVDLFTHAGNYYEVLEYAPYDLFSVVMVAKMSNEDVYCIFRQIVDGVDYLHNLGLAHRDLKLDNCVMTQDNVVKIIDFGTATVFRTPGSSNTLPATGVVGSDPYLAPEVLSQKAYDPRLTDVWSLAIIFLCMHLRRFPWKLPDTRRDRSFRLFVQEHPDLLADHQPTGHERQTADTTVTSPALSGIRSITSPRSSQGMRSETRSTCVSTAPTTHSHSDMATHHPMKHTKLGHHAEPVLTPVQEPVSLAPAVADRQLDEPAAHLFSALHLSTPTDLAPLSPINPQEPRSPVPLEANPTMYINLPGASSASLMHATFSGRASSQRTRSRASRAVLRSERPSTERPSTSGSGPLTQIPTASEAGYAFNFDDAQSSPARSQGSVVEAHGEDAQEHEEDAATLADTRATSPQLSDRSVLLVAEPEAKDCEPSLGQDATLASPAMESSQPRSATLPAPPAVGSSQPRSATLPASAFRRDGDDSHRVSQEWQRAARRLSTSHVECSAGPANATRVPPGAAPWSRGQGEGQAQARQSVPATLSSVPQLSPTVPIHDSVFSQCPPETRAALRRMLAINPAQRSTLGELLRGKRFADALTPLSYQPGESKTVEVPCGLVGSSTLPARTKCTPLPRASTGLGLGLGIEWEDTGDAWLKSISTCSASPQPSHTHRHPHLEDIKFHRGSPRRP